MPKFSDKSLSKLATCNPDLQRVFHEVIHDFDCTIIEGHRGVNWHAKLTHFGG